MKTTNELYKTKAINAAQKAGDYLYDSFFNEKKVPFKKKAKNELVTKYDLKAQDIILKELKSLKFNILSEEMPYEDHGSDYEWVIDPLDATTNFFLHYPVFGVSIALLYKQEIIFSVIYNPITDELFWAEKSKGAYRNKKKIFMNKSLRKDHTYIAMCEGYKTKEKEIMEKFKITNNEHITYRMYGCACVELTNLAMGNLDIVFMQGVNLWDVAAGILLVSEAGKSVINFKKKPYSLKDHSFIAFSPQKKKEFYNFL